KQLVLWAPKEQLRDTFGAVELHHTNGYGQNRAGTRASAVVQQGFTLGDWRLRLLGIVYGARSGLAGVLRQDDIDSGSVGFFDAYDHPTATAQNALAMRGIVGMFGEYRGLSGDHAELGLWLSADRFRIQQNLTGFIERSRTLAGVAGQGDLIEQRNGTTSGGLSARYRSTALDYDPIHAHVEL